MTVGIVVTVATVAIGVVAMANVATVAAMAATKVDTKGAVTSVVKQRPKVAQKAAQKAEPTAEANARNAMIGQWEMKGSAQSPSTSVAAMSTQFANATRTDQKGVASRVEKVVTSSRAEKIAVMVAVVLAPSVKPDRRTRSPKRLPRKLQCHKQLPTTCPAPICLTPTTPRVKFKQRDAAIAAVDGDVIVTKTSKVWSTQPLRRTTTSPQPSVRFRLAFPVSQPRRRRPPLTTAEPRQQTHVRKAAKFVAVDGVAIATAGNVVTNSATPQHLPKVSSQVER